MNVKDFEKSSNQKNEDWEPVTLPEDATLAGFEPLLNMPQEVFYLPKKIDKELARNGFRFLKFIYTADFLCGIKLQVMEYDVRDKTFKLHVDDKYKENGIEDGQVNGIQKQPSLSQEEDGVCGENSETSKVVTGSGSSEIEKLKSRKEELTRKKADQERHQQEVQAVLSDTNAIRKRFEIHPDYIIADTNCFIDHLEGIKKLVATDHFRLQVPLVVVNELDGLSKGCDVMRDDQHNSKVVIGAKAALEFLSKIFTPPCHPKVMCVTAQGNVLKTLQFTSESYFGQNRDCNDDIILDCCKTHCRDDGIIKDNVQHFVRNAILLTDDRALRVKAVNSDVPTRDIQKFLLLMRIS
uniref:PIN domain-containing protein n=1 Tax=Strigamia maritima TaxID=126957 RepID=T1JID0_STRMM